MEPHEILEGRDSFLSFLTEHGYEVITHTDPLVEDAVFIDLGEYRLLAITEATATDRIRELRNYFLIERGLTHCVVLYADRIHFFRSYGEGRHFLYSARTKDNISKIDKLRNISENFDGLFHRRDISGHFYEEFKKKRNTLVERLSDSIPPIRRYLLAQKIFDRVFFVYFLCHKGIVTTDNGVSMSGENFFRILLQEGDFEDNLKRVFHCFNTRDLDSLTIGTHTFVIPYLNGGLFRPDPFEHGLSLEIDDSEWEDIFSFLNRYHWLIEESLEPLLDDDIPILTPEIIGHVYERSVVEWEKVGFEREVEESVRGGARRSKGVYYTPHEITQYIAQNTIHPHILRKLDRSEHNIQSLIDTNDSELLQQILATVSSLTVLDPACGSGAFLIQAAETLFRLRVQLLFRLGQPVDYYVVKLNVITENIYGVDILEGAVEIAKLRLWLWLISDYQPGNHVQALPNIEYNLRVGNSLLGWLSESLVQSSLQIPLTEEVKGIFLGLITYSPEEERAIFVKTKDLLSEYALDSYIEAYTLLYKVYRKSHGLKAENLKEILERVRQSIYGAVTPTYLEYLKTLPSRTPSKTTLDEVEQSGPFHWRVDFGHIIRESGFDVIIGNPPYGNTIPSSHRKVLRPALFIMQEFRGTFNSAAAFIERSASLLTQGGHLGLIVPNSLCRVNEFGRTRDLLFQKTRLLRIIDEGAPFPEVTLEMVTILFEKTPMDSDYDFEVLSRRSNVPLSQNTISTTDCNRYDRMILYQDELWDMIASRSLFNVLEGVRGPTPCAPVRTSPSKTHHIPVLVSGKTIQPYRFIPSQFRWGSKAVLDSETVSEIYEGWGLLSTRLSHVYRVGLKPAGLVAADNVIRLTPAENLDKYAVMLVLNSSLMSYVTRRYLFNYIDLTMYLNSITDSTPISLPPDESQFAHCATYLLFLNQLQEFEEALDIEEMREFFQKLGDAMVFTHYLSLAPVSVEMRSIPIEDWLFYRFNPSVKSSKTRLKSLTSEILLQVQEVYTGLCSDETLSKAVSEVLANPRVVTIVNENSSF